MTRLNSVRSVGAFAGLATLCTVTALVMLAAARVGAQGATGVMPNWRDLETWSRPAGSARDMELGLGLQVNGASGVTMISFSGQLDSRSPRTPPKQILVIAAPSVLSNPNAIRTPGLRFSLDDGTPRRAATIDVSGRVTVDDPTPRAIIHSETVMLGADEFLRIAEAKTSRVSIFGSDGAFRPDQLKAIADLAGRLNFTVKTQAP